MAGQGLPVPAADRARGRRAGGAACSRSSCRRCGGRRCAARPAVVARAAVLAVLAGDRWRGRLPRSRSRPSAPRSWPAPAACPAAARWAPGSATNVPEGATMLAIGPSMANIVQFYGHRKAYGLSVSPNPLRRNPSYEPVGNPNRRIRAERDPVRRVGRLLGRPLEVLLAPALPRYVEPYHGRVVHTYTVAVQPRRPDRRGAGDPRSTRCGRSDARAVLALLRRSLARGRAAARRRRPEPDARRSSTSSC